MGYFTEDTFGKLKEHISISGRAKPGVRSSVFDILKLTMLITLACCLLVTARTYIGKNINCLTGFTKDIHKAVENYCFISGTFTVPGLSDKESAHPGVGPLPIDVGPDPRSDETGKVTLHAYYQWVPLVLALQTVLFYLPELIWEQIDKGYFETTLCKLNEVYVNEAEAENHIKASASYMAKTMTQHRRYAILFLLVEMFGIAVAIGNLFITNAFLGGDFFAYGPNAVRYFKAPADDYSNPLNQVFPKMAKCTWHKYGASGTVETYDAMCVLPLNIVNEKTYVLLWFTFIITTILAGIFFLCHLVLFIKASFRNSYLLKLPMKTLTRDLTENILKKGNLGDWFLIWNYKSQMMYFREWIKQVNDTIIALKLQEGTQQMEQLEGSMSTGNSL